jgi:hypothetical protein
MSLSIVGPGGDLSGRIRYSFSVNKLTQDQEDERSYCEQFDACRDVEDGGLIVQGCQTSKTARLSLTNQSKAQDSIKSQDIEDNHIQQSQHTDKRK